MKLSAGLVPIHLTLDVNPATGSMSLNGGARGTQPRQPTTARELELDADALLAISETWTLDVAENEGPTLDEITGYIDITASVPGRSKPALAELFHRAPVDREGRAMSARRSCPGARAPFFRPRTGR